MALVFTQADLDNLKAALVSGALEVSIGDRTVKYRSQKEIIATIKLIQAQLDPEPEDTSDPSVIRAKFSRGGS